MASVAYGMVPDLHVSDVLSLVLTTHANVATAVVRCIDSSHCERSLTDILNRRGTRHNKVHGNVCLTAGDLQHEVSTGLFSGFDEVWLFGGEAPAFDLSSLPAATSDGVDFSAQPVPPELQEAVARSQCVLLVGDGCGLNYVTNDPKLAEEIRRMGESP